MIRINLLPVRQTRKLEAARLELGLALAGGVLVVLLSAGAWGFFTYRLSSVREENRLLQAEIDRLAADVAKVDEMEKFKAELERKLSVIEDLRKKKSGPVRMLDEMASAAPEKLFVTKLEEKDGEVRITGVSVSNDVISQFLRALDASPYFDQVFLQDIEALPPEKNLSVTLKTFKLSAKLVSPPDAPVAGNDATPAGASTPGAVPADPAAAPAPTPAATPPAEGAATPAPGGGA